MPDQAFSKILSMAGPEIPARHQTLNHILTILLDPNPNQHQLTIQLEAEPQLLLQYLSGGGLKNWPVAVDETACLDRVLTLANSLGSDSSGRAWQRSRLAGILAEHLGSAANFSKMEVHRCRLLAILLDIGHKQLSSDAFQLPRDAQIANETERFGVDGVTLAVSQLGDLGFPIRDCDVLRYQYEGLDILNEATEDILLVALAGRLADAMLTDFELAGHYFDLIHDRLGIDATELRGILEQAYAAFRDANDTLLSLGDFEVNLSRANLAAQIRLCKSTADLHRVAQQVLDFREILFAVPVGDDLVFDVSGEQFAVTVNSSNSLISKAFQLKTAFSAEENALVAIVDKQVFARLSTSALWLLPLNSAGVAMCVPGRSDTVRDEFLLKVFSDTCRTLLESNVPNGEVMIEMDRVQQRIRELTHEVNNPLAIVQNYLKTLSLKLGPDSVAQPDIETISREMLRIGGIIQKYGDIGSDISESLHPVDLNKLLQSLVGVFQGSHPAMTFQCDVDPNMPPVMGVTDHLKQVVVNLVKNATEALDQVEEPYIWLATNARVNLGGQHYVEIIVQDNGPGIPLDIYQHLFSTNNSSKGGSHSGIGLSLANRLITEMGGLISCKTSSASGSQFQILLPLKQSLEQSSEQHLKQTPKPPPEQQSV